MNWYSTIRPYIPYILLGMLFLWGILGLVNLWLKRQIDKEINRLLSKQDKS